MEEVIDTIKDTFAENGYEVGIDPPKMWIDDIEGPEFERIMKECLSALNIDISMKSNPMMMMGMGNMSELFDAIGLHRLDPDEVSPKWLLPKGFFG